MKASSLEEETAAQQRTAVQQRIAAAAATQLLQCSMLSMYAEFVD